MSGAASQGIKIANLLHTYMLLVLERNWNMWIPGFGTEDVRPYRKSATTEAHKARMALIRKALKKY